MRTEKTISCLAWADASNKNIQPLNFQSPYSQTIRIGK